MDAREVCIIITGAHKVRNWHPLGEGYGFHDAVCIWLIIFVLQSIALAKCIEEGVNHMWTVSAIQMHPKGLIVCDEDATLELHVKVIQVYFGPTLGWDHSPRDFPREEYADLINSSYSLDCKVLQVYWTCTSLSYWCREPVFAG